MFFLSLPSHCSSPPPHPSFLWQGCHSSCPIRKWSGKKYFKVVEKSGNFIWSQRKLTFSRKIREKWSNLHAWSIPLKAGGNTRGHSTIFFLNEEGKFCWKFISLKERVERTAVRWGQKPLVDLKFCIFLAGEIWFLKSQGSLRSDVCGNHVWAYNKKLYFSLFGLTKPCILSLCFHLFFFFHLLPVLVLTIYDL